MSKLRSNPSVEEKELTAPQTSTPSVQILDAIEFEELYKAGEIELFDPSITKHDLFLISVDNKADIDQKAYDDAKKKRTPILIREKDKFFIYDKTGNGSWILTEITQNLLELSNLPFKKKGTVSLLGKNDPKFTLSLISTLRNKGHVLTTKPIKKVISLKEKFYILTSSFIPAVGFGLGNTIAVLMKFVAPIAGVGGAGLYISTTVMTALTGGFGLIALGLMYMMYRNATQEAIKKIETFNHQLERLQEEIDSKAGKVLNDFNKAFAMLLKMKLALEQLKRSREASNPSSNPSQEEISIQERIDSYINFLAQQPHHPNFQKIQDEKTRKKEVAEASKHQFFLKMELDRACEEILNDKTVSVKHHIQKADDYANNLINDKIFRDNCFPTLHFIAPKAKRPPFININLREFFTAFGSAFGPIFGLPFLTIGLISIFTVIPMAFPPLYPILALAVVYGLYNVYRVNDTKKLEAERNVEKLNMQKHLGYYHYSHNKLLKDRLHTELEEYTKYQYHVIATQFSPKPQLSPEFKKQPTAGPTLSQKPAVDYRPSSEGDLTRSLSRENVTFHDPQQLAALTPNNITPSQSPASSSEEVKKTLPSLTTPGLSVFSSSKNSEFSSSSQDLLGLKETLEGEEVSFYTPDQFTKLSATKPAVV